MKLRTRLQRLEKLAVDSGCRACLGRRVRTVFVNVQRQPNAEITYGDDKPVPCSLCGKVPAFIIRIVETIVKEYPSDDP